MKMQRKLEKINEQLELMRRMQKSVKLMLKKKRLKRPEQQQMKLENGWRRMKTTLNLPRGIYYKRESKGFLL
jgi:hypothetical protein